MRAMGPTWMQLISWAPMLIGLALTLWGLWSRQVRPLYAAALLFTPLALFLAAASFPIGLFGLLLPVSILMAAREVQQGKRGLAALLLLVPTATVAWLALTTRWSS